GWRAAGIARLPGCVRHLQCWYNGGVGAATTGGAVSMSIESILGPGGIIARRLPRFEVRPQQEQMARAVQDALANRHPLMIQAGTGVGKSFSYLVPAIEAAAADKEKRIVISTHTISLQEQLVGKDIPFLHTVMPDDFRAALVKGRANYLSLRRLR